MDIVPKPVLLILLHLVSEISCQDQCTTICQNGGTCIRTAEGETCICKNGWEGPNCESNKDDCDTGPCYNGGTCHDRVGYYFCECPPGKTGLRCHLDDQCLTSPCPPGASCDTSPIDGSVVCECPNGFIGLSCSDDIDECQSFVRSPCENDGVCINTEGSFYCECQAGYHGPRCEIEINECASYPCATDCICVDKVGSYECQCLEDDQCASNPCDDNCTCVDQVDSYECQCTDEVEYGSYVIQRLMPGQLNGNEKIFVDTEAVVRGPGRLLKWRLYVTYNPQFPQVPIRMQIWRKINPKVHASEDSDFEFLYEDRYILTSDHDGLVEFDPEEEYAFNTDVLFGWLVEGEWYPINYDFNAEYKLHFVNRGSSYPIPGEIYTFGKLHYPAIPSVGITVASSTLHSMGAARTAEICSTSQDDLHLTCPGSQEIVNPLYVHSATTVPVNPGLVQCDGTASDIPASSCGQAAQEPLQTCHGEVQCTVDGAMAIEAQPKCPVMNNQIDVLQVKYSCMLDIQTIGNDIRQRVNSGFLSRPRSWVDNSMVVRGPGKLLAWNVFVTHNTSWPRIPVRLQLWETVPNEEDTFQLLYETKYKFTSDHNGAVTIYPAEQYEFRHDVRYGITFEEFSWVPIAREYQESYLLNFLNLDSTSSTKLPVIGKKYTFGPLPYPAIFSLNVMVDATASSTASLPIAEEVSGETLNVLSPNYPQKMSESLSSFKCTVSPTRSITDFKVVVEIVLLELEPAFTNCDQSMLFEGGETVNWCSDDNGIREVKTKFNISVENTLEITYHKTIGKSGGRFWLRLEGFRGNSQIGLSLTYEDNIEPSEQPFPGEENGNVTPDDNEVLVGRDGVSPRNDDTPREDDNANEGATTKGRFAFVALLQLCFYLTVRMS